MSSSRFHIWLRVGQTSIRLCLRAACIGLPFVPKRCLRVYRAEFATTQLLDLTVWVGLSASCTCTALALLSALVPPKTPFDLRLDKITQNMYHHTTTTICRPWNLQSHYYKHRLKDLHSTNQHIRQVFLFKSPLQLILICLSVWLLR